MTLDIIIIASLIIVALILMVVEMLLVPGFGIAGLGAIGAFIYVNYYAFTELGNIAGFITLFTSLLSAGLLVTFVLRSKAIDKMGLEKNIDSTVASEASKQVKVGDTGIAITRLALIGNALINDNIVEVKSESGLVDEGEPVEVVRLSEDTVFVKTIK